MRVFLFRLLLLTALLSLTAAPALFSAQADLRRADQALAAARPLEAAARLEHAALLLFWRADLMERAGRAAFAGGDMAEAARLLGRSRRLSVDGWRELGEAYRQLGRFDDAERAYRRGLEIYGPQAPLYRGLALAYNAQGNFEAEMAAFREYAALDGTEAAARYRLGLLLSLYDPERALPELQASAELDADYDSVVQTMRSALNLASLESDEARRLTIIGRGLGLAQEWQLAREAFQRAVGADGENAEAWAWLGEAKQHLGQDGGEELERAVALSPFSATVRALYGLYWKRQDEPQLALAQFQWAAAIEPENPAWFAALGDAYASAGDLPPALAAYQRAAELAPAEASYWRMLAAFSIQYHFQVEEVAIPAAQKALKLEPNLPASYDLLGQAFLAAALYEQAEENLLAALRLDPNYAPAHLHVGMLYLEWGRPDAARAHLIQAQALDPEGADGAAAESLLALYFP